jgi:hypothetical protein
VHFHSLRFCSAEIDTLVVLVTGEYSHFPVALLYVPEGQLLFISEAEPVHELPETEHDALKAL